MTTFLLQTTNPTQVEVGIEYFLPTDDLHWIPHGFSSVSLTVDANDLDYDYWVALDEVAEKWCDANGFDFSQVLMEP